MVGSTGDLPLDLFAIFEEGKKKERGSSFTFQHDFRFSFHFNQSIMIIIIPDDSGPLVVDSHFFHFFFIFILFFWL